MYVVKNEGSWVLFTKSNYLLNRALLNRGLVVHWAWTSVNVIKEIPKISKIIHHGTVSRGITLKMECSINPGIVRITVIKVPIIEDSLYIHFLDLDRNFFQTWRRILSNLLVCCQYFRCWFRWKSHKRCYKGKSWD